MKMPLRYVCEMVCDRVAASQIYLGDKYTDASPWEYYERSKTHYLLHPETRALLEELLKMVRDLGHDRTFEHMKYLLGCEKRLLKGIFLPENTAEGDPAVFFRRHEKTQKAPARCCAFLPKDHAAAPKRCAPVPKGGRIFVFFCELTLLPGGGTIDKTDRRGSVWM